MPSATPEENRAKVAASTYAKKFLMRKYYDEYRELYHAYLRNRGFNLNSYNPPMVDERLINPLDNGNKTE